jgi:aryl-alcohol dehydrogenase-like predicted oxidoreductase
VGVDDSNAQACVDRAFDIGINFIDTANIYGRGAAESFLGKALHGRDRSSYILATKLFFPMTERDRGLSAAQIYKQIDASLSRLRTDYVDLYQCHRYDPDTPLEETMEALSSVVRQGKARYIGFSEWKREQISASLKVPAPKSSSRVSRNTRFYGAFRRRKYFRCAGKWNRADCLVAARSGSITGNISPENRRPEFARGKSGDELLLR